LPDCFDACVVEEEQRTWTKRLKATDHDK